MDNITVKIIGQRASLTPADGHMLQRGTDTTLRSSALVPNKQKELRQWRAVAVA